MIRIFLVFCIVVIFNASMDAQIKTDLNQIKAPANFENIYVEKLAEDSLSSVFLIWVKKFVPFHKHLEHTESVYILEGSGEMQLGDSIFQVNAGNYLFIPKNTPHKVVVTSQNPLKVISIQTPMFDGSDRVVLEK